MVSAPGIALTVKLANGHVLGAPGKIARWQGFPVTSPWCEKAIFGVATNSSEAFATVALKLTISMTAASTTAVKRLKSILARRGLFRVGDLQIIEHEYDICVAGEQLTSL